MVRCTQYALFMSGQNGRRVCFSERRRIQTYLRGQTLNLGCLELAVTLWKLEIGSATKRTLAAVRSLIREGSQFDHEDVSSAAYRTWTTTLRFSAMEHPKINIWFSPKSAPVFSSAFHTVYVSMKPKIKVKSKINISIFVYLRKLQSDKATLSLKIFVNEIE